MATTWGETATPLIDAANNMARLANEMSDGRLEIKVDSANKHKSPLNWLAHQWIFLWDFIKLHLIITQGGMKQHLKCNLS